MWLFLDATHDRQGDVVILLGAILVAFGLWFAGLVFVETRRPEALKLGGRSDRAENNPPRFVRVSRLQSALIRRLSPPKRIARLEKIIQRSGRQADFTPEKIISYKIFGALFGGILGFAFFLSSPDSLGLFAFVLGILGGYVFPDRLVTTRAEARRNAVSYALPDAIDQLAVTVRAGLGVDGAIVRVSKTLRGPIAEELARVVQDIQLGIARPDALKAMADRMEIAELNYFVRALVQADALGIPIANTLATQSDEMRLRRKLKAEEAAMQLPVKILAPLALFILPALMIVVIGPVAVNILRSL